jgi:hypothetical protein
MTASASLLNRSRQRRALLSASFAWLERAAAAEMFQQPEFRLVVAAMQSKRLDCLLEAALAGFDLDLVTASEERMSWWWIHEICLYRQSLRLETTALSSWADLWLSVSAAMQLVCDRLDTADSSYCSPLR